MNPKRRFGWRLIIGTCCLCSLAALGQTVPAGGIRLGSRGRIVAVHPGNRRIPANTGPQADAQAAGLTPPVPLAGFAPLVAITASDEHQDAGNFEFEHRLEPAYIGLALNPPANENIVIGTLDSGSVVDLVAEPFATLIGLSGSNLTGNPIPLGGVGGEIEGEVSYPIGIFVAGLSAVQPDGTLDLAQVVGHSNVSAVATPEIACNDQIAITATVGTPLIAFYKSIIRIDQPQEAVVYGQTYKSPDIRLVRTVDAATLAKFPRTISIAFGGPAPATTATYYPDIFGDFETPFIPTLLAAAAGDIPFGGAFFGNIGMIQGEPSPTNPLQTFRVLVDTGAQSSIISSGTASDLNLDMGNPDFLVDVCGIGGISQVPGFYIDYLKINAGGAGGPLEFAKVPVVVQDLDSPDGLPLAGILGMNVFWNRNMIFDPSLSGSGFVRVSNPIPFAYGDFDRDFDVDADDADVFGQCTSGPGIVQLDPLCRVFDADGDLDVDQTDFAVFQICISGKKHTADVNCGPAR